MSQVQRLTKPSLVDLLRMCDKNRWCSPRIRYASIRSKPELCKDLVQFFTFREEGEFILIRPIRNIVAFPVLRYQVRERQFWMNGRPFDCARVSRQKPQFQMERKEVTLHFGELRCKRGNGRGAVAALMFPTPG